MEGLFDPAHLINFIALLSYILVKELLLDKHRLHKELKDAQSRRDPLKALELDLTGLKAKVVNLEDAIEQQGETISDKLDLILTDFKEKHNENRADLKEMQGAISDLSQRISAVETQLKIRRR